MDTDTNMVDTSADALSHNGFGRTVSPDLTVSFYKQQCIMTIKVLYLYVSTLVEVGSELCEKNIQLHATANSNCCCRCNCMVMCFLGTL